MWDDDSLDPWAERAGDDGRSRDRKSRDHLRDSGSREGGFLEAAFHEDAPRGGRPGDDDLARGGGQLADGVADANAGGPQTARSRVAFLVVIVLVVLTTLVLCCVAIGQAARLIDVDPSQL